jgi:hypothetical protein
MSDSSSSEVLASSFSVSFDASRSPLFRAGQPIVGSSSLHWLGADVSTSIVLSQNRSVWLFGDTLVGTLTPNRTRNIVTMPRNSLALMDRGAHALQFYVRYDAQTPSNEHLGFFSPANQSHWLWLTSGFLLHDTLFLLGVTCAPDPSGSAGFAFQFVDTVVVRVANPLDDPLQWNWTLSHVPGTNATTNWNSAVTVVGDRVFVLGQTAGGATRLAALRVTDVLHDNWSALTLVSDSVVDAFGPPETTLTFVTAIQRWIFFGVVFGSSDLTMYISQSSALDDQRAWSARVVWHIPPPFSPYPQAFCYAPKVHQEFSNATMLMITLCCNTPQIQGLINNDELYIPVPLLMRI